MRGYKRGLMKEGVRTSAEAVSAPRIRRVTIRAVWSNQGEWSLLCVTGSIFFSWELSSLPGKQLSEDETPSGEIIL